ncbi:hypothetical protein K438DRAFT_1985596 [Mycena galopus ATCC 62051]|nr:hypothetical protein K438DRAFT_1985596 [Mycena galopus ATCC 62051]
MVLFKYLEDKNIFQTFYMTKLSKRLIHGVSVSDEVETCPYQRTSRTNHDDIDIAFSLMMLGTNFWPLARPTHDFLLPPELLPTFERFTRYYQTKAAVLLQYNCNDTLSLPELQEATKISTEILTQVLALLVKVPPGFKAKIRVNLNLPIKADVKAESSDAQDGGRGQQVRDPDDDRADHEGTQDDKEPSRRWSRTDIKKAIETLLEKEYIERADGSKYARTDSSLTHRSPPLPCSISAPAYSASFFANSLASYVHPAFERTLQTRLRLAFCHPCTYAGVVELSLDWSVARLARSVSEADDRAAGALNGPE